ncbi:MAG: cyclic nucleotide-binding domain-containing protein [Actinomycetota bacterium]|nr:cyclic nucleotide-binding domain-containing protein [Actinomycetota bacterium]
MADTEREGLENLRSIPLFEHLSDDALNEILRCATEFEADAGHVLVQPNQAGTGLFVIEEGSVTVELPGKRIELGPGDFFGELALLREEERHTARVSASTWVRCMAIRRDDFDTLLEKEPVIATPMLKTLAKRLAERF